MTGSTSSRSDGTAVPSERSLLLGVTFVVAFCSIAYELVYSELLRMVFGGTVVRYSITIGLFLFSLGIGALVFNYVDVDRTDFFRVEVALALAGPLGLVWVLGLNTLVVPRPWTGGIDPAVATALLWVSHVPIVVVGLLSGLEVPFLASMVETDHSAFSEVLGIDYVGSLAGTVVWALVLFPTVGVVTAVFLLGLLNAAVAIGFHLRFGTGSRVALAFALVLSSTYVGAVVADDRVEASLTEAYLEGEIERDFAEGTVSVEITDRFNTRYQEVLLYDRKRERFNRTERCMRLDMQRQLCDSWARSYHSGLVDVPMSTYNDTENVSVLLVGGGDWIAVNRLREYNVSIDQVDLDGQFMEWARDSPLLEQFHDDAYEYDRLNTTNADALDYLRRNQQEYDLVVLDLPGARNDELLPLYSTEFYTLLREHLTDRGLVVTWAYSKYQFPQHNRAYINTVGAAGFDRSLSYRAYDELDGSAGADTAEYFYMFSTGREPALRPNRSKSANIRKYANRYTGKEWEATTTYEGVRVNSVFHPNYDIIVN